MNDRPDPPMAETLPEPSTAPSLADLRREIDRIDAEMHRLLIERGTIIDRLIAVKKTFDSGSAFRPGREASMMRVLAERHHGLLPFDTVESIWRVMIATFTFVQAPYAVHADVSIGDAPMRDTARFHFGFTVPCHMHDSARAVIHAVAHSAGDLGILAAEGHEGNGAWWLELIGEGRPKIIARLPFVERPNHPAGTPVFVVSKPLADAAVRELVLYAVTVEQWRGDIAPELADLGAAIEASIDQEGGLRALLISLPGATPAVELVRSLSALGLSASACHEVGSHSNRFHLATPSSRDDTP